MRYKVQDYARAYIDTKPASKDFLRVIEKNGDFSRLEKIVTAIEELVTKEAGGRMVHLEFAREHEHIKKFKFSPKDHVKISINPTLIAGVRVTIDGSSELDQSFKRKVNQLSI